MHEINEKRERLGEYQRLCVELQSHENTRHSVQETVLTRNCTLLLGCFYLLYMLYSNLSRVLCC